MSKILLFGNQKGGVGKTTLTALTANALSLPPFSRRVFVADLDQQQTLIRRRLADLRDLDGDQVPPYKLEAKTIAELLAEIEELDRAFDVILIDAAGKIDAQHPAELQEITKLLALADFLFVPVIAGNYALDSTLDYLRLAFKIKARRPERPLEVIAVVNMAELQTIDARQLSEELAEIRAMIPALRVMKTPLHRYSAFRAIDTLTSLYIPGKVDKARANFRQWIEELVKIIGKK